MDPCAEATRLYKRLPAIPLELRNEFIRQMLADPEMPVRTTRDSSGGLSSLYEELEHIIVTHPDRKNTLRKVHNLDDYIKNFNISLMALQDKIAAKELLMRNLCKVFVRHFPRQLLGENAAPYRQRLITSLTERDRIANLYKGRTLTLAESSPAEDPALAAAKFLADPERLGTNAIDRRRHALKAHQKYWTRSSPQNEEGGGSGGSTNKGGRRRNRRTRKN